MHNFLSKKTRENQPLFSALYETHLAEDALSDAISQNAISVNHPPLSYSQNPTSPLHGDLIKSFIFAINTVN
jgi:hypothetical protein